MILPTNVRWDCSPASNTLMISIKPEFLAEFWDWMHINWPGSSNYEGTYEGCSSSDIESFNEYVGKFLKKQNENL